MTTLIVKDGRVGPVLAGHPWVFTGAIEQIPEGIEAGEPVRLVDRSGRYIASGYFNPNSQIAVRIWGRQDAETIDGDFFARRIGRALELRRALVSKETDAFRLINAEGDLMPGLIVDHYAGHLVIQFHTQGMDKWRNEIIEGLIGTVKPASIYERSDLRARRTQDGQRHGASGQVHAETPVLIEIKENALSFMVDAKAGQKTGFFLDQREKRAALMKYARGKRVLNCFSYTGGFSVYALAAGAAHVTSMDSSGPALELAKRNVQINGMDESKCSFICEDAKDYLKNLSPGEFDLIVLDPPSFIKDHKKVAEGLRGYRGINMAAMRAMPEGGVLMSCSCSTHLSLADFRHMLMESASRAGALFQELECMTNSPDHPVLLPYNEGHYLKCIVLHRAQ